MLPLALAGCPSGEAGEQAAPPAERGAPPSATVTQPADSLRLSLDVPREVRAGEAVPMVLRVANAAGRPLDLYLRGRTVAFDVVVARADGRVAWRRLEGEIVPAIVQLRTLAPGEVLTLGAGWDGRVAGGAAPPGEYSARGLLLTDAAEPLATPAVPLRIVAR